MYQFDKRIVMTLDAGGTNFVFSAIRSNEEIVECQSRYLPMVIIWKNAWKQWSRVSRLLN